VETATKRNEVCKDIKERINSGNSWYYSIKKYQSIYFPKQ